MKVPLLNCLNIIETGFTALLLSLLTLPSLPKKLCRMFFFKIWLKRVDLNDIQNFSAYLFIVTGNEVYKVLKRIARNYKITLLTDEDQSLANNDTADLVMEKEYILHKG
jgi:DNA-directed RNA polymerase specialized sigma24 family protein